MIPWRPAITGVTSRTPHTKTLGPQIIYQTIRSESLAKTVQPPRLSPHTYTENIRTASWELSPWFHPAEENRGKGKRWRRLGLFWLLHWVFPHWILGGYNTSTNCFGQSTVHCNGKKNVCSMSVPRSLSFKGFFMFFLIRTQRIPFSWKELKMVHNLNQTGYNQNAPDRSCNLTNGKRI